MEPKPFKSVDDQIAILQDRGMEICDDEFARRALREIGYYRRRCQWVVAMSSLNASVGVR